jgi:hypothetical protein
LLRLANTQPASSATSPISSRSLTP